MPATVPPEGPPGWLPIPAGSGFGLDNLPFGVDTAGHVVVAAGDHAVDLSRLEGLDVRREVWESGSLNAFMAMGRPAWERTRARLAELLGPGSPSQPAALRPLHQVDLVLPWEVGDYVDFYSSEHHATNMSRLLRPHAPDLPPAWRHLPIGYHGRSGTVVVGGSPIPRPRGMVSTDDGPAYRPSGRLDVEVELGFVVGRGSTRGAPVPAAEVADHVFGVVLVNDWSARDIQAFEYRPLGPFLAKAFATSVSPWVVPLAALSPYAVAGPTQDPVPAPHFQVPEPRNLDVRLELRVNGSTLSRTTSATLYWSMAQQIAHLTSGGASLRTGDLIATGTISGPDPGSEGSLMELGRGQQWLADADEVTIAGWCGERGERWLSLGEVSGVISPTSPAAMGAGRPRAGTSAAGGASRPGEAG